MNPSETIQRTDKIKHMAKISYTAIDIQECSENIALYSLLTEAARVISSMSRRHWYLGRFYSTLPASIPQSVHDILLAAESRELNQRSTLTVLVHQVLLQLVLRVFEHG